MIRFCSIFIAVLLYAATAWAQPVNTQAITDTHDVLPAMTWLPNPHNAIDYATASSSAMQGQFIPLTDGFPLKATGPGWLRLELAKNAQIASTTPSRVDKKSLYLNLSFLPSGKAILYKTGSFSPQGGSSHTPLATRVHAFQTERLADPSISNAVYYLQLEETPGLWFNPTLSRTDSKSPILPHELLLPSILLACLAFCLLRLAINRTVWPLWAAAILVCVITELLLSVPISEKTLTYSDLFSLLMPGISVMIYAHLGRLLLYSPASLPKADLFLQGYPIVGAIAALLPLVPGCYWVTRLFPLWGLLLIPLLCVATHAFFRQIKGGFAYFIATFMPVLGAFIALYGMYNPSLNTISQTGTFWGVAIGSFALIFAKAAQPTPQKTTEAEKQAEQTATLDILPHPLAEKTPDHLVEPVSEQTLGQTISEEVGQGTEKREMVPPPASLASSSTKETKQKKSVKEDFSAISMTEEPDDIFSRLQHTDFSVKTQESDSSASSGAPIDSIKPTTDTAQVASIARELGLDETLLTKDLPRSEASTNAVEAYPAQQHEGEAQVSKTAQPLLKEAPTPIVDDQTSGLPHNANTNLTPTGKKASEEDVLDLGEPLLSPPQPKGTLGLDWPAAEEIPFSSTSIDIFGSDSDSSTDPLLTLTPQVTQLQRKNLDAEKQPMGDEAQDDMPQEQVPSQRQDSESVPTGKQDAKADAPSEDAEPTVPQAESTISSAPRVESVPPTTEAVDSRAHSIPPSTEPTLPHIAGDKPASTPKEASAPLGEAKIDVHPVPTESSTTQEHLEKTDETVVERHPSATTLLGATVTASPHTEQSGKKASPSTPIIHLEDGSLEGEVSPQVMHKVDTVLASLEAVELQPQTTEYIELDAIDTHQDNEAPSTEHSLGIDTAKAYIDSLLTPGEKRIVHEGVDRDNPFASDALPHTPHGAEGADAQSIHGSHSIIVTEMTTSNKRLLRSYFSEVGIPCIETHGVSEVRAIQEETGSPLIIYDADSPEDSIIKCMKELNASASHPPKHLILSSVEAQAQRLVEQGATLAIPKPFTKESLFAGTRTVAPELFEKHDIQDTDHTAPASPLAPKQLPKPASKAAETSATTTSSPTDTTVSVDSYARDLLNTPQGSTARLHSSETGKENEKRIDDLLAQLNNGSVSEDSPSTQSSTEQTESVLTKMLATEADTLGSSPSTTVQDGVLPASAKKVPQDHEESVGEPSFKPSSSSSALPDETLHADKQTESTATVSEEDSSQTPATTEGAASSPQMDSAGKKQATPVKDSLLDFIVPESDEGNLDTSASIEETQTAPDTSATRSTEGLQPLEGLEGEYIEQLMLPLIPGLLYALKDGLRDAELGLTEQNLFNIQQAAEAMSSKAETFGLMKLEKIAQCVERASHANDLEATTALLEDLGSITKRYITSLEACYNDYIAGSRS